MLTQRKCPVPSPRSAGGVLILMGRVRVRGRALQTALLLAVSVTALPSTAKSEDWMYRRSYFSHMLPPGVPPEYPLPESRSAYRPAFYREALGGSVRSAYRINNYIIQNGPRSDRTFYREGYIEFNP